MTREDEVKDEIELGMIALLCCTERDSPRPF